MLVILYIHTVAFWSKTRTGETSLSYMHLEFVQLYCIEVHTNYYVPVGDSVYYYTKVRYADKDINEFLSDMNLFK